MSHTMIEDFFINCKTLAGEDLGSTPFGERAFEGKPDVIPLDGPYGIFDHFYVEGQPEDDDSLPFHIAEDAQWQYARECYKALAQGEQMPRPKQVEVNGSMLLFSYQPMDDAGDPALPLRHALPEHWVELLGDQQYMDWLTDTHCGAEVVKITQLADYVCAQWPDVVQEVQEAAVHQCHVVCNG